MWAVSAVWLLLAASFARRLQPPPNLCQVHVWSLRSDRAPHFPKSCEKVVDSTEVLLFTCVSDCRAGSAVSRSQSGEAEKRPAGCASAGAGGGAQRQGAGEAALWSRDSGSSLTGGEYGSTLCALRFTVELSTFILHLLNKIYILVAYVFLQQKTTKYFMFLPSINYYFSAHHWSFLSLLLFWWSKFTGQLCLLLE